MTYLPDITHMNRIGQICGQTTASPAENKESTFRGTTFAPEQGRARVVFAYRPVLVWLSESEDEKLRHLFGRGYRHFRDNQHRYDFIYHDGNRAYVHVGQADEFFGRDE